MAQLTHQDRCETCGAQALVAGKVNGTWLMYCGNHSRRYEARLRPLSLPNGSMTETLQILSSWS